MMYNDDINYIHGRLQKTVVRLNTGAPVLINGVHLKRDNIFSVSFSTLGNNIARELNLDKFDLSSPPLGNTNIFGKSYYISRLPLRNDWRQGLRSSNLVVYNQGQGKRWRFESYKPLEIPILNVYPSFKDALKMIEDYHNSCAFSRVFSIDDNLRLFYKEKRVGKVKVNGELTLEHDFQWLHETLGEDCGDAGQICQRVLW